MKKRFIFDENYIKRYANRNKTRWLIVGMCVLVFISVIIIVLLINKGNRNRVKPNTKIPTFEIKEEMVLESGSELPETVDYFRKLENINVDDIEIIYPEEFELSYNMKACSEEELEEINENNNPEDYICAVPVLNTPTVYGISVKVMDKEYTVNLKIEDNTAPDLKLKELEIMKGEEYNIEDFVSECYDATGECGLNYYGFDKDENDNVIDYSQYKDVGEYKVRIVAYDNYNNITEPVETTLRIVEPDSEVYVVTFDANGGSAVGSINVEGGKTVSEPNNPTRDGYLFTGWYLGDSKFDFSTPIDKNMTLKANWQKNSGSGGLNPSVPGVVNVTSVSLNYAKIYLDINQSKTVVASVKPNNATNKTVTWTSANNNIAKVDGGVITGVGIGTTTITASAGGKSATVEVVVRSAASGCQYGDASYNTSYVLSVTLASNNCAVNPNINYNETVSSVDYNKLMNQDLPGLGYNVSNLVGVYKADYYKVKNNSGTGLVGYQITVTVSFGGKTSVYIINPNGTRKFIRNDFGLK